MAGYTRTDTTNEIADGKVIKASAFDAEYEAIEDAFDEVTGHSHDGSSQEGAPIEVTGPNQEYLSTATEFSPKTDDTYDLGSVTLQWKDLYVDGVAYLDSVDIDAGTIDGVVIGGTSVAAGSFTTVNASGTITGNLTGNVTGDLTGDVTGNLTGNVTGDLTGDVTGNVTGNVTGDLTGDVTGNVTGALTGNADTATILATARNISLSGDVTGTVSFNGSTNADIVSTVANDSHTHTLSTITDAGTIASQNSSAVSITGGTITGITTFTPGAGDVDLSAATVTLAPNMAPTPAATDAPGYWKAISSGVGAALVLDAGGTWAYSAVRYNNGVASNGATGVAAGGSTVGPAASGQNWTGFAWRIQE